MLVLAGLWPLLSFAPPLGFDVSSAERGWGVLLNPTPKGVGNSMSLNVCFYYIQVMPTAYI